MDEKLQSEDITLASPITSSAAGPTETYPGAGRMLMLLLAINLFNYIDRQVLSATLPKIELEFFTPNDKHINRDLGFLTSAFLIVYMLASPFFGSLGDKRSRWLLVGVGVVLWSLASGASGLAATYAILLITRCFVGIGEAAYGPVAPSMISDMYPTAHRGRVLSFFYMAIPVGSALGFVLGGLIAGQYGWRWAFYAVTFPGIVLGLICFWMKEPPRYKSAVEVKTDNYFQRVGAIWRIRSFRYCTLGMICTTFVLGGVAAFAPKYIHERIGQLQITDETLQKLTEARNAAGEQLVPAGAITQIAKLKTGEPVDIPTMRKMLGGNLSPDVLANHYERIVSASSVEGVMSLDRINFLFGVIVVVSGLLATLSGGILGDYLRKYFHGAYFLVCGYSAIISFPLFLGMILLPFPYAWIFLFLAVFGLFFNTGPANTILANVTHSSSRSTAFAFNILVIHLFGDAISPFIIGGMADEWSWETAMIVTSLLIFAAGIFWTIGASSLDADTDTASGIVPVKSGVFVTGVK